MNDWKHMTDAANDNADESSFAWAVIGILCAIAFTLIFSTEIWEYMDWIMSVEENFRR